MMHQKVIRRAGSPALLSLGILCGGVAACAGTDVLDIDQATRDDICANYPCGGSAGSGQMGTAASGGSAGAPMGGDGGDGAGDGTGGDPMAGGAAGMPMGGDGGDVGMGGDGGEAGSGGGSCDGFAVLSSSCSGASCHGDGAFLSPFASSEANAMGLVGMPSPSYGEGCGSLFDPGSPTASLVFQKASGTQGSSCGGTMPPTSMGLEDADLDCLESWIASLQ